MPMRVHCGRCGFPLYEGVDVKPPYEIVQENDGRCPSCSKKLRHIPKSIEIEPLLKSPNERRGAQECM